MVVFPFRCSVGLAMRPSKSRSVPAFPAFPMSRGSEVRELSPISRPRSPKTGLGYTEFLVRHPIHAFSYNLIAPNNSRFRGLRLYALHNKRRTSVTQQRTGGEVTFAYGPTRLHEGDALKFTVSKGR